MSEYRYVCLSCRLELQRAAVTANTRYLGLYSHREVCADPVAFLQLSHGVAIYRTMDCGPVIEVSRPASPDAST